MGTFEYWWTHGLISDETYGKLWSTCKYDAAEHPSEECQKIYEVAYDEQGNIDFYSLYTPTCKKTSLDKRRLIRGRMVCLSCYKNLRFLIANGSIVH